MAAGFFQSEFIRFSHYAVNMVNIKYYTDAAEAHGMERQLVRPSLDKLLLENLKRVPGKTTSCLSWRIPRWNIRKAFSKTWSIQSAGTDSQGSGKKGQDRRQWEPGKNPF
jgi:hypothetical protein